MVLPGAVETARLPAEYQEVEYIQSSGTQYVDTGVVATNGFEMETKIAITATSEYYAVICGAHELSAPYKRNFVAYAQTAGKIEIDAGDLITQTAVSLNEGANVIKASNISNNFSLSINDVPYSVSGGGATTAYSSRTLYLLWCNGYNLGAPLTGKLYYHKMYTGGALVRDFVPCYRKSDNAAGLYDLVYGVFHGNAGTGAFIAGPKVSGTAPPSSGEAADFTYTGNYTDNRVNGKGTVRLNTSGILTTEETLTVIVYILGAGGGCVYAGGWWASGGGGGNQTITVTLEPGTYEVVIGTGGTAINSTESTAAAGNGGDTTAFGATSTGGIGGSSISGAETPGIGGSPNGVDGTYGPGFREGEGGTPNGGGYLTSGPQPGGDGYVEFTFI